MSPLLLLVWLLLLVFGQEVDVNLDIIDRPIPADLDYPVPVFVSTGFISPSAAPTATVRPSSGPTTTPSTSGSGTSFLASITGISSLVTFSPAPSVLANSNQMFDFVQYLGQFVASAANVTSFNRTLVGFYTNITHSNVTTVDPAKHSLVEQGAFNETGFLGWHLHWDSSAITIAMNGSKVQVKAMTTGGKHKETEWQAVKHWFCADDGKTIQTEVDTWLSKYLLSVLLLWFGLADAYDATVGTKRALFWLAFSVSLLGAILKGLPFACTAYNATSTVIHNFVADFSWKIILLVVPWVKLEKQIEKEGGPRGRVDKSLSKVAHFFRMLSNASLSWLAMKSWAWVKKTSKKGSRQAKRKEERDAEKAKNKQGSLRGLEGGTGGRRRLNRSSEAAS